MKQEETIMVNDFSHRFNIPSWIFLGLAFPLFVLNIWVFAFVFNAFQGIISSVILAGFLSLLLNHPIRFLQNRLDLNRGYAIFLVFVSFALAFGIIAIFVTPIIIIKFSELINILPSWIQSATFQVDSLGDWAKRHSAIVDSDEIISNLAENFKQQLQAFIKGIPQFIFGAIGSILNIFFIFVLTIFFLFYGNSLIKNSLQFWLSADIGETIQQTLYRNFNNYLLNQLVLATALNITIIPTLYILQTPFPLLFGLTIGTLGFIPFGAIIGLFGVSFILLLGNFWVGLKVLVIVLLIDQIIENTIPPRLLGKLTGLNPIVILLSVTVGATVGDFIGLITAVPLAATIKSLVITFGKSKSSEIEKIAS